MRIRSFAALAATATLVLAACGDDDDEAGSDTTAAVAAVAPVTEPAAEDTEPAAEVTEPAAEVTEAAAEETEAMVDTTEAAAGAETTAAAAGAETTEAGAATATTDGAAGADTTEAAAATETSAAVATSEPGAPGEPGAITVGSADFPESQLLAQIYGQALENVGFDVDYELGIGAREAYLGAIEGGEVDLLPEYTGSLLAFLVAPEQPEATTVEEQVAAIGEALPEGLEVLTPSTAEDKDVIVCTQEVADEHGLTNLSSLFEASTTADITIGAPPEFEDRTPFGKLGFEEIYGAEIDFVPLDIPDIAAALEAGEIDCGNLFSTMSAMQTEGFVALEDDVDIIPHEAVLPLVRSEVVTPELTEALDAVNAQLDTEILTELLSQVTDDQLGVDVVAEEWLASLGEAPDGTEAPATTAGPATTEPEGTEPPGTTEAPETTDASATSAPDTTGETATA